MKLTFFVLFKKLKKIIYIYDGHHMDLKLFLLQSISKISLPKDKKLIEYHDLLLFLASHPENIKINKLVDLEFHRIGHLVKSTKNHTKNLFLTCFAFAVPLVKLMSFHCCTVCAAVANVVPASLNTPRPASSHRVLPES